jgi:hypothetical protein
MEGIEAIIEDLARQRDQVVAYFRGMSAETLHTGCTESEFPGGAAWSPKDHLAHLAVRERDFVHLLRRGAGGETGLLADRGSTSEEQDAYVNRENQREVDARRGLGLEPLLREFLDARDETCRLLRRIASSGHRTMALAPGNEVPIDALAGASGTHARLHLDLLGRVVRADAAGD